MSLLRRERLGFGIGAHAVSCTGMAGVRPPTQPFDTTASMPETEKSRRLEQALTALQAMPSVNSPSRRPMARIVVADGLARYWLMQPPSSVGSLAELQAVVQARCQQLFGSGQRWRIAGDWNARRPFLCTAIPAWIFEATSAVFGADNEANGALPLALGKFASQVPKNGWVCVTFPGCSSLLGIVNDRIRSLRTLPMNPTSSINDQLTSAAQELRRESLRTQIALNAPVRWCPLAGESTVADLTREQVLEGLRFVAVPQAEARLLDPVETAADFADAAAAARLAAIH